jgi:hypothetical protein
MLLIYIILQGKFVNDLKSRNFGSSSNIIQILNFALKYTRRGKLDDLNLHYPLY